MRKVDGKSIAVEKHGKIKKSVFFFSIYLITMLFQTNVYNLGTLVALGSMLISFFFFILEKTRIRINVLLVALVTFLIYSFSVTVLNGYGCDIGYLGQIVFCCVAISYNLSKYEYKYLKDMFVNSMVFYSILVIFSCVRNSSERYFHGRIILFGSSMDPNFIGIPLGFTSSLLVWHLFFSNGKRISVVMKLLICFIAIFFTASRGNFLSFLVDFTLILIYFINYKGIGKKKRLCLLFAVILFAILVAILALTLFPQEISRMTNFSDGADNGRFDIWTKSLGIWATAPMFGRGIGANFGIGGFEAHNTYLALLSETGFIGFFLFAFFGLYSIVKIKRIDLSLFVASIGLLVHYWHGFR